MKILKRILAVFLTVCMMIPSVSTFAENEMTNVKAAETLTATVKAGYSSNYISWDDAEAASYNVLRADAVNGTFTKVNVTAVADTDSVTGYTYQDTTAEKNTRHYYKVEACREDGTVAATSASAQDDVATGMEGLKKYAALSKEFEEGEQTFDGNRVVDMSANASSVHAVNTGSIILRFKVEAGSTGNRVLLGTKDKTVDSSGVGTGRDCTTIFINNTNQVRFAYKHTVASLAGPHPFMDGDWHTVVLSSLPEGGPSMRLTIDGQEMWSNSGANNRGMFAKQGILDQVTIGGHYAANSTTVENGFKGAISQIIVTNETLTSADAIQISKDGYSGEIESGLNISSMFNSDPDNSWVFTGGRVVEGTFEDIRGGRNYVGHFEEYVRNQKSAGDNPTRQRNMMNTAKEGQTIADIVNNWDNRVSQFKPQAVAYMVGSEDYSAGTAGVDTFKVQLKNFIDKALAEKSNTGIAVIQTPYALADSTENAKIEAYIEAINAVVAAYEDDSDKYSNILVVDFYESTKTNDTFKTTMLNENGTLNMKGHLELGKLLSLATIKASDNYPCRQGVALNYAEEAQPPNYLEVEPTVTSSGTSVNVTIPSGHGDTWKYRLDMEGTVVSDTVSANSFEITDLIADKAYVLTIQSADGTKQLRTMKGIVGGGNGSLNQQVLNANQQRLADKMAADDSMNWLFIGDSITHGLVYSYGYTNVPQTVERYLKDVLGRKDDVVINTAVSGATTQSTLNNIEERLTKYAPDVVSIMLGTNDAAASENTTTAQYEERLRQIITLIRELNSEAIIILRSPTPMTGNNTDAAYRRPNTLKNIEVMKQIAAEQTDIIYIDQYDAMNEALTTYGWLGAEGINGRGILGNWLHPGTNGLLQMAKMFIKGCGLWTEDSELSNLLYDLKITDDTSAVVPDMEAAVDQILLSAEALTEKSGLQIGDIILKATEKDGTKSYEVKAKAGEAYAKLSGLPTNAAYVVETSAYLTNEAKYVTFAAQEIALSEEDALIIDVVLENNIAKKLTENTVISELFMSLMAPEGDYTYTLCEGNGSTHNAFFKIDGSTLKAAKALTAGEEYSIRVKASNGTVETETVLVIAAVGEQLIFEEADIEITAGSSVDLTDESYAENVLAMDGGTIIVDYTSTDDYAIQSLFSVANSTNNAKHMHIFVTPGGMLGVEIRDTGVFDYNGATIRANTAVTAGERNIIAFKADPETKEYKLFANGQLVATTDAFVLGQGFKYIKDITGVDTVWVGATKRTTTTGYPFGGTIHNIKVYQTPFEDEDLIEATTIREGEDDDTIKVACVGDSLTDGYKSSGGNKSNTAYPARLQTLLGDGYDVRNFGKTSYTLMKGTDKSYWDSNEFTQSKEFAPDIVIIMLGTNDSKTVYWDAAQFKEDATALVNEYKNLPSNPRVIFATSPKCFVESGTDITGAGVETMKAVQEELIEANEWETVDMFAKTENKEDLYHSDKVHFTDAGYLYIAQCMYEAITGEKLPVEESITIPHTQTTGTTNYFTFADGQWTAGNANHTWSNTPNAQNPRATYYEVKFTGHKIDIYAGKNHPMGNVEYFIDGESVGTFDLYRSSNIDSTYITTIDGLTEGEHTFRAEATGTKNESATNTLIDAAQVVVYYNREVKPAQLHGTIVDENLQYTAEKYRFIENTDVKEEILKAWKNDSVSSQISLISIDSEYTNVMVEASDFTNEGNIIASENVKLSFMKSVEAYTGMPGYGSTTRPVPEGSRAEANELLYQDAAAPINIGTNEVQNVWVAIAVPKTAAAGSYTGTITVTADELETPLTFTYTLEVADATLADAEDFKDGFDIELWQNPYRIAEYYDVEPFSEEHLAIMEPHMRLYKDAGGYAITTSIVEEAWAGQTYGEGDVKFPSMVDWTKKADGTWEFDYTDFDKWVTFNKQVMGIGSKIVCYSIAPWTNAVVYYDEATNTTVTKELTAGSADWTEIWTAFLNDLADHLVEKGWFEQTYIGIDERGFSAAAFDLIDTIERGYPSPTKLKTAGAMDGFVNKKDLALRLDVLSVGSIAVKAHPAEFEELRQEREDAGKITTIYTCTGHAPGSFALSAPGESYWTMMYAYSVGGTGYMRWAYDSWVADPLRDVTHNAFEAGDTFLVYPDEKTSENPVSKSSSRFEKMKEGVRDINKLMQMKNEVPRLSAEIDALMDTIKATYATNGYYLSEAGKEALAADMAVVKNAIADLTEEYIVYKDNGTTEVESVSIADGNFTLVVGNTKQLQATVLPETVLDNTVIWSSSAEAVATVRDGLVTAVRPGSSVITATSTLDPTKTASVTVTVEAVTIDDDSQLYYYSFDEMNGNVITDNWGDRNGTNNGGTLVDGKSGTAIQFADAAKNVTFPEDGTLTQDWTVSYWVYNTSTAEDRVSILGNTAGNYSLDARISSSNGKAGVHVNTTSGGYLTFNYQLPKNTWVNMTWTQSKTSGLALYVNGSLVQTNNWTVNNAYAAPIDVLGMTNFTGSIDELKVYNRALNASEVVVAMQVKGLNIAETDVDVYIGETYQIVTELISDNADKTITYTSSNPEVVAVSETGLVTALKKGTAIITVENAAGGFTEEVTINSTKRLYTNSRIPQYELPDEYLMDIEKAPGTDRQYLGQPDMIRTKTGRLITAYPVGHGHGPIVMQISDDNGETWTEKTDIPESWADCQETPTLYVLNMADGTERLMLISACPSWDLNKGGWETSYSDDNGETWTEYAHFWSELNGSKHATIVAMCSLVQLKNDEGNFIDKWMGVYHDYSYVNYKTYLTFDEEGNEVWSKPEPYLSEYRDIESSHQICEVGLFRSPDGSRIVGLARSQSHAHLSTMFYSEDEGETWSEPVEIQGSLAGERHKAVYDPISGRLLITFREIRYGEQIDSSWMAGEWVAWVGTYEDLMEQNEGQYRILIEEDWAQNAKSGDTGYAGIVVLEDGTFIMDSYGHFDREFSENAAAQGGYNVRTDLCYIKQAKFKLGDIDNALGLVDRSALKAKIDEVKDTEQGDYSDDTYAAFAEALSEAEAVWADSSAQQIQIDIALEALIDAFEGLTVDTSIDVSGLQAILNEYDELVETTYTISSWAALESVLDRVNAAIAEANEKTQDEIDALAVSLAAEAEVVAEALEGRGNVSELNKLIEASKELKQEDYTEETWNVYQKALEEAKAAAADNSDLTQAQVVALRDALVKAEADLEEIPDTKPDDKPNTNPDDSNKADSNKDDSDKNESPVTGDISMAFLYIMMMTVCAAVILIKRKRA